MNEKELKAYLDRWDLVQEIEARELREANLELLVRQMLAIWQFNRSLGFSDPNALPDSSWGNLQKKWLERRG